MDSVNNEILISLDAPRVLSTGPLDKDRASLRRLVDGVPHWLDVEKATRKSRPRVGKILASILPEGHPSFRVFRLHFSSSESDLASGFATTYLLRFDSPVETGHLVSALEDDQRVRWASPNSFSATQGGKTSGVGPRANSSALAMVNYIHPGNAHPETVVAFVDSKIEPSTWLNLDDRSTSLVGRNTYRSCGGHEVNCNLGSWESINGGRDVHGTFLAHLVGSSEAGRLRGLVPGVKILALETHRPMHHAQRRETRTIATTCALATAIGHAADLGVDVLNLSLGYPSREPAVEDALVRAAQSGVSTVAALGHGRRAEWPGKHTDLVLGVAAINSAFRMWRSNFGDPFGDYVLAPGEAIVARVPGQAPPRLNGTSCAAGFVSALAAAWVSQQEHRSQSCAAKVEDVIRGACTSGNLPASSGAGLINFTNTLAH